VFTLSKMARTKKSAIILIAVATLFAAVFAAVGAVAILSQPRLLNRHATTIRYPTYKCERLYVTRESLIHPKYSETPWSRFYRNGKDHELIAFIRFDRKTFNYILSYFGPAFRRESLRRFKASRTSTRILKVSCGESAFPSSDFKHLDLSSHRNLIITGARCSGAHAVVLLFDCRSTNDCSLFWDHGRNDVYVLSYCNSGLPSNPKPDQGMSHSVPQSSEDEDVRSFDSSPTPSCMS
jgi:hypothetical protein